MKLGIIVFIAIFVMMLALPVVVAGLYYRHKGPILNIRQDYTRDVRYFGHSFAALMAEALPNMKGDTIFLSKPEKVLEIKAGQTIQSALAAKASTGDAAAGAMNGAGAGAGAGAMNGSDADVAAASSAGEIDELVVAREASLFLDCDGLVFNNEIYSEKDVILLGEETVARAIYSKERILLGDYTKILRWADAEKTIVTYHDCDLGRSVTAGEQLLIGGGNIFHRLYAPKIRLGQDVDSPDLYLETRDPRIFRLPVLNDVEFNRRYIADDMISENGTVPHTIISKGNVKVIENIILQGDIHSDKSVRIMENSVVLGNIFAEKEVLIERNATVLGDIFTQGSIVLEEGAAVGQPNKTSSVIAREKITFYGNNYVFGFVSSEAGGKVL